MMDDKIKFATELLKSGEVVSLPTETVYGLAADASNDMAVAKIYALKNRPSFNPLIVHVCDLAAAQKIGVFSKNALAHAEKYWEGPLTIVVPKRDKNFAKLAGAGLDTIAIRVPAHPVMREVLKSGLMLAAPSANISGNISPTTADHVKMNFPNTHVIDGGSCAVGLESTVITFNENDEPVILRHGVLQIPNATRYTLHATISPGQLLKHYAPKNKLRINVDVPNSDEIFIGYGSVKCDFNLSEKENLVEAASNLFAMLHAADSLGRNIAVAKIPKTEVGIAINDRLNRAAH